MNLATAFRLVPEIIPEQDLHEAAAAMCSKLVMAPAVWTFYPAGAVQLTPAQAAKLSRMGLQRGWPDFLFLHDFKLRGIELKRQGGRLSKTRIVRTRRGSPRILEGQEDTFPKLEAAGMSIAIAHSVDEMLDHLTRWQIPLRSHHR